MKMNRAKLKLWLKQNNVTHVPSYLQRDLRLVTFSLRIEQMKKVKLLAKKLGVKPSRVLDVLVEEFAKHDNE